MTMTIKTLATLSLTAALLAGCASMNVFKDDSSPPPAIENDLAPDDDANLTLDNSSSQKSKPTASGVKAAEITKALAGKSWKWSSDRVSGVTLYANDGSSLVEVTGKGTTTGNWVAKDGQLCEKLSPAPFLPKGKDEVCNPVTKIADGYQVGPAKFTLSN